MPRVSILIPLHNCEKTIRRSLDSVFAQTFQDFEIIAVLNNCDDNTELILREYDEKFPQNMSFFNCSIPGIVPTLNTGIPHCTATLIARQDDDDYWYPTKLEKQIKFLDENPHIDIVGTQLRQVNEEGIPLNAELVHPTTDLEIKQKLFSGNNSLVHPTVVFRKHIFLQAGTYDAHYRFAEDYHFWLKCCKWYKFANLDEVLLDYTVWHNSEYDPQVVPMTCEMMRFLYSNIGLG